jgi:DNA-binding transcriptional regulator YdaS (Cro superfamily)
MPKVNPKHAAAVGATILAATVGAYSAQARGGDTSATTPTTPGGKGHGPGHHGGPRGDESALAKALGVSKSKLSDALKAIRDDQKSGTDKKDPKGQEAKALADALGVDEATITKVFEAQRPQRPNGPAPTTPQGTTPTPPAPPTTPQGTTPGKGDHRGGPGGGRRGGHGFGGPGGGRGFGGPGLGGPNHAALVTALAKATGKSESDVTAAFDKLEAARKTEREAREKALATALADKLGLSVDKVTKAIESVRPKAPAGPAPTTPAPTTP